MCLMLLYLSFLQVLICIFVIVVYIYIYIYIYIISIYLYFYVLLFVFSVICMHQGSESNAIPILCMYVLYMWQN